MSANLLMSAGVPLEYEEGKCTYYGEEAEVPEGYFTYCGVYSRWTMETAHYDVPNMPSGTRLRATNLDNNQSVEVTANDLGPGGRPGFILDLTYAAFGKIADRDLGVVNCSYQIYLPEEAIQMQD